MHKNNVNALTLSSMLVAIGIIIPLFSPFKIILEPASFTLGSHIPIFIAMFISPMSAFLVVIGTTLGFFLGGFPIVVVMRAASHIIFALLGARLIKKYDLLNSSSLKIHLFSILIAFIHAISELLVVTAFYFIGNMNTLYYAQGFLQSVLLLVGLGSVIHSLIDFELSFILNKIVFSKRNKI